eukprot:2778218-Pyramimonas_sp.AAC.1
MRGRTRKRGGGRRGGASERQSTVAGLGPNSVVRCRFVFAFLRAVFALPLLRSESKANAVHEIAKT